MAKPARALEKISDATQRASESAVDEQVNPLCIFGEERGLARLFATHPSLDKRIQRLRA